MFNPIYGFRGRITLTIYWWIYKTFFFHGKKDYEETIKELCTLKYTYDHQQRKILISKDIMKKKFNVKSPNRADALIMAVSLVGEINYAQTRHYFKEPIYSQEEDMFKIAGIR